MKDKIIISFMLILGIILSIVGISKTMIILSTTSIENKLFISEKVTLGYNTGYIITNKQTQERWLAIDRIGIIPLTQVD